MSASSPTGRTVRSLQGQRLPLAEAGEQRSVLRKLPLAKDFQDALRPLGLWPLRSKSIETLQINLGKLCNQTCRHCHVDAGPDRTEIMSVETAAQCIDVLRRHDIPRLDITGGAPELNPSFRWIIEQASALGRHVMNRCNLTILNAGAHRDLPELFAQHRVELVCSLPHYRALNTDRQRGEGVFDKSIRALRRLNALGYGDGSSGLRLVLVTNPVGAFLPASQESLEAEWKRELWRRHEVRFDALYTITNMPISRYLQWLIDSGNLEPYMERLLASFNPRAADKLMCRDTLSVGWDGRLYDCDFNQMLEIGVNAEGPTHIADFDFSALEYRPIMTDRHCFGCTAGAGSSCGGATAG
jgi:radical SAM/Cys-rich protein